MGLRNMVLQENYSGSATFTGIPLALVGAPVTIQNGFQLICTSDPFQTRKTVTVKSRPPAYDPKTKTFTKQKSSISISAPEALADGTVVYNTIRAELEMHPSAVTVTYDSLLGYLISFLTDQYSHPFLKNGTLD